MPDHEADGLTKEEHKARHQELHEYFDELLADFIANNPTKHLQETTLMELIEWSADQIN